MGWRSPEIDVRSPGSSIAVGMSVPDACGHFMTLPVVLHLTLLCATTFQATPSLDRAQSPASPHHNQSRWVTLKPESLPQDNTPLPVDPEG